MRAANLAKALEQVRLTHGPDAMVLATRTVLSKAQDGLAPVPEVEIVLADGEPARDGRAAPPSPYAAAMQRGPSAPAAELSRQLARLERVARQIEELGQAIDAPAVGAQEYPLADALRRGGAAEVTLRQLAASFQLASRGGPANLAVARRHLETFLRATRVPSLAKMGGEHWFLGRAGAGKTTLTLHLAAALGREGRRVGIIAVSPRHDGDVRRLEAALQALQIRGGSAFDARELDALRDDLRGCDVVLVDTPCCLSRRLELQAPSTAYRHLLVPLGEDPLLLRHAATALSDGMPDALAVTQTDLFPRPARLLDLVREVGRPVAFLLGQEGGAIQARLASQESLVRMVLGANDVQPELAARAKAEA